MANVIKILAQAFPSAASATTLYTVPSTSTSTTVSSIVVCNQSATATSFRIWLRQGSASDGSTQYIYYDVPIAGNDTFVFTGGITLSSTSGTADNIRIYATLGTLSFNLFGVETT